MFVIVPSKFVAPSSLVAGLKLPNSTQNIRIFMHTDNGMTSSAFIKEACEDGELKM